MIQPNSVVYESQLESLRLIYRGKVRDLYEVDDRHMLMVASDRLSAFDVILFEMHETSLVSHTMRTSRKTARSLESLGGKKALYLFYYAAFFNGGSRDN